MTGDPTKPQGLHPNVKIRLGMQFALGLTTNMVTPFLAIYFATQVGLTMTGVMVITVTIAGMLGGLIGGALSDRWGRRKWMLLSEGAMSVTWLVVAWMNSPWARSLYGTFFAMLINLFFAGSMEPTVQAMILDVSPAIIRKRIYFLSYWLKNLSMAVGVSLGGFLFLTHRFALMSCVAAATLMSLGTTIVLLKETHDGLSARVRLGQSASAVAMGMLQSEVVQIYHQYKIVAKNRVFLVLTGSAVLLNGLENQLPNYIGIRLSTAMTPTKIMQVGSYSVSVKGIAMVGLLQAENTVLVVLFVGLVAYLTRKLKNSQSILVGVVLYTLGYAVLGASLSPWVLFIAMFTITIGELLYSPVRQVYLAELVPDNARGAYYALYQLNAQLATLLGGAFILVARVLPSWGIPFLYVAMGAGGMGSLVYVLRMRAHRVERQMVHL